ncbi:hypothetical protein Tco_1375440 [Tanacetum coccineum]
MYNVFGGESVDFRIVKLADSRAKGCCYRKARSSWNDFGLTVSLHAIATVVFSSANLPNLKAKFPQMVILDMGHRLLPSIS